MTTPDFWAAYRSLIPELRRKARAAYRLWRVNPRHCSFCFNPVGALWSVRSDRSHRALALLDGDTYYWFRIGTHDDYERLITV